MSVDYRRKLYALLYDPQHPEVGDAICQELACIKDSLAGIKTWWQNYAENLAVQIASSSDRVNLEPNSEVTNNDKIEIRHPITGQQQYLNSTQIATESIKELIPDYIQQCRDIEKVYWWFWRFYPEIKAQNQANFLLHPAYYILPDCPLHSYQATVSAVVGAMYPENWSSDKEEHPYLILFTFSPVQEFIKASRKFLDFWAGSYLLHYLSAKLCWCIANQYGPDAIITPSLWSQEIIDALIYEQYDDFGSYFESISTDECNPVTRFNEKKSTSLATAGFPNVITALVPGKKAARELGEKLTDCLKEEWKKIADKVKANIRETVTNLIPEDDKFDELWSKISDEFPSDNHNNYKAEIKQWRQGGCWSWNDLWDAQIDNSWEPYWTAVPLGNPEQNLTIPNNIDKQDDTFQQWEESQNKLANARVQSPEYKIPTKAEIALYDDFNVGTWWGSFQARLAQLIQSVKNTRNWQIATAPGERSTLSGQLTALHPQQLYNNKFREGGGLPAGSLRLFWRVMAEAYPGLFNGSEKLNAIELTKRMAWDYGGVANSLGIDLAIDKNEDSSTEFDEQTQPNESQEEEDKTPEVDYEKLVRFPNLSSIAASRLIYQLAKDNPNKIKLYWQDLQTKIQEQEIQNDLKLFKRRERRKYYSKTRRNFQVPKVDIALKEAFSNKKYLYNGVMFSSKWLVDDMGLNKDQSPKNKEHQPKQNDKVTILRSLVEQAHKDTGFTKGSPADWWVIVLGDGDGMGKYVSGRKLGCYEKYIVEEKVAQAVREHKHYPNLLRKTKKRMGPATHVALNRALLDFSNRLVPYITERRFCGKVIYSGGDDVMAVLPLADLPEFLLSIRAAWSGAEDPQEEFNTYQTDSSNSEANSSNSEASGYWHPKQELRAQGKLQGIPQRPLFTMGKDVTMSLGIVIAYKTVPLPTVLETLWTAEKERAKEMPGAAAQDGINSIPIKDGLCFRVIYGSGNVLEALMKGHLLQSWWKVIDEARNPKKGEKIDLSPLLYRLAEELPKHTAITENDGLIAKATQVIINRREQNFPQDLCNNLTNWLNSWEDWAYRANPNYDKDILGTRIEDLSKLLRFTAFWLDKMAQFDDWITGGKK